MICFYIYNIFGLYFYVSGKTEFSSEEDAHVIADCVKVSILTINVDFFV